jgi:predicted nucleotidyltransferase
MTAEAQARRPEAELAARDPVLAKIVRRLVAAYQPERIYLFGSVARGEAGPDSDYDLLVVVPDDAPPARKRSRLAYEALRGTGAAAEVLVCTHSYFEARRHLKASLPGTILREGRLLHAARPDPGYRMASGAEGTPLRDG